MSPVHIPRGFTKAYIAGEVVEDLGARITAAQATFRDYDVLLIEGTGPRRRRGRHRAVECAVAAASLGAPAIIISEGGVGRPIDEIVLNASLFTRHGVPVAGAIVNKVDVEGPAGHRGHPRARAGAVRHPAAGHPAGPTDPLEPDARDDPRGRQRRTIHDGPDLERVIDGVAIGAMEPGHMLERVGPGTLVIVPGDREDIILTLTTAHLVGTPHLAPSTGQNEPTLELDLGHAGAAIGLVLTGGYRPRPAVLDAIRRADLFAILVASDTYTVASEVHDLLVKTHAADREKIELIKALVASNLDVDRILAVATETAPAR